MRAEPAEQTQSRVGTGALMEIYTVCTTSCLSFRLRCWWIWLRVLPRWLQWSSSHETTGCSSGSDCTCPGDMPSGDTYLWLVRRWKLETAMEAFRRLRNGIIRSGPRSLAADPWTARLATALMLGRTGAAYTCNILYTASPPARARAGQGWPLPSVPGPAIAGLATGPQSSNRVECQVSIGFVTRSLCHGT